MKLFTELFVAMANLITLVLMSPLTKLFNTSKTHAQCSVQRFLIICVCRLFNNLLILKCLSVLKFALLGV